MLLEGGPVSTWVHGHEAERNRRPDRGSALGQVCGLRPRVSHGGRIRRGCERTRRDQEDGGREGDTGQRNGGSGHGRCGGDGELLGQVDGVCGVRAPRVRARDGVGSGETADRRAQHLGHSAQTAVRPGQPFGQRSKDKTPTSPDKASADAGEAFRSVPRGTNGQPLGLLSASYTGARPGQPHSPKHAAPWKVLEEWPTPAPLSLTSTQSRQWSSGLGSQDSRPTLEPTEEPPSSLCS